MSKPAPLRHGVHYHIYNRGNNRENLFREERNYPYFLKLYAKHIEPVAETFAYCLLKNHFHFLVRIKDPKGFEQHPKGLEDPSGVKLPEPSQCFSNLFNAYTKSINKAYERTGSLFEHPFGRIAVTRHAYLMRLVTYIHQNPQKHGFVADFRDWPYSSYHALSDPSGPNRESVLEWFYNREQFANAHAQLIAENEIVALAPDDFD